MTLLFLDALPPRTNKGTILRLLIEVGGIERLDVGAIELQGRQATIEVPAGSLNRLVQVLDGAKLGNQYIRAWSRDAASNASDLSEDHFQRLSRLLELEARAEEQQLLDSLQRHSGEEAERSGYSLVHLVMREETGGLGGRVLITLGKRNQAEPLPWTRLGIGTPVLLSEESTSLGSGWRGVISGRQENTIQVALEKWPEVKNERATFRLDLAGDEVARQRQRMALNRARTARGDRLVEWRRILLGQQSPSFQQQRDLAYEPLDKTLNESQQAAVQFALTANDVAIIHGPPGTGKTTTVVELIRQAVLRGQTVLACAPSNLAVDNILERLLAVGEKTLRLGHPARVLPELRTHTLDLLVDNHPDVRLARKLAREGYALRDQAAKHSRAKPAPGAKQAMRQEAKEMLADARRMEAQVIEQLLDSAKIICATTTGLDSELLGQRTFDLCVIDEAGQSTEPGAWIPLLRSRRLVLAGDHCQLPPTVVSIEAARQGFGVSLMERLLQQLGPHLSRRLTVQYRMHEAIMTFSSNEFYESTLQADPAVQGHLLSDLPGVEANELTTTPVHFIDTAGASFDEALEPDGESRLNPQEAELVRQKVQALLKAGLAPQEIGVITPYAAQVRLLQELLRQPGLEIDTVDGFQGREKEAIVISLVRSNLSGEIGFLADERRMNVALTRARRKLLVIGDSATITSQSFYQRLIDYFEAIDAYHSVWEEI